LMLFTKNLILINISLFLFGFFASSFTILFTLYAELVQNDSIKISYYNAAIAAGWLTGVQFGGIFIDFFGIQQIFLFSFIIFLISVFFVIFIKEDRQLILEHSMKLNEEDLNEISESITEKNNSNFKSIYYSIFFRSFGIRPILGIIVILMNFHLTSNTEIGFLIGINPLLQFFLLLYIGRLITHKNLKSFMLLGYILSVFIIIGYIFSFDFWSFMVIQILVSSSFSIFWMASVIYIAKNSTPKNKGSFIGKANSSGFAGDSIGGIFFTIMLVIFQSDYYMAMYFMLVFPVISVVVISLKFKPK
ncbi:MAG: MFS transporter, partial [Candidatus Lokiarchaeota archaeon]|nr:MFS transporter [Candidatus Lokiarchaeota archaeon]